MLFVSPQKLFSFLRYFSFCLDFLVMYRKGLIKKIKINFKFYDVTAWLINNCNNILPNISRSLILFLMFACNNFPFRAFVTMIYWTSTEVLQNLVAPLYLAAPSLDFEQVNVFWTSVFDSFSFAQCQQKFSWILFLAFDLSVPSSDLERINIWFMALIPLALHSFPLWFAQFQQKAP